MSTSLEFERVRLVKRLGAVYCVVAFAAPAALHPERSVLSVLGRMV
jgi:hypothetical protein